MAKSIISVAKEKEEEEEVDAVNRPSLSLPFQKISSFRDFNMAAMRQYPLVGRGRAAVVPSASFRGVLMLRDVATGPGRAGGERGN